MTDTRLSIRLDLSNGGRIGPDKIALLEAIRAKGRLLPRRGIWGWPIAQHGYWSNRSMKHCANLLSLPQPADNVAAGLC